MNNIASFQNLSLAELEKFAGKLAAILKTGDILALEGDLGAGKSAFARAALRALGISEDIPSPSFTLIQTYNTSCGQVLHCDFYRLSGETEVIGLGVFDQLADSIALIEWPGRSENLLKPQALWIKLDFTDDLDRRNLTLSGSHNWKARIESLCP